MAPSLGTAALALTALGAVALLAGSGLDGPRLGSRFGSAFLGWRHEADAAPQPRGNPLGYTDVAVRLNAQMAMNPAKVYSGGKGVLIRYIFDGYQDDSDKKVVPATFWVNDIFAPSQMYPVGNPLHPVDTAKDDAWQWPVVGVVVGSSLNQFFENFDHIQDDNWGYGVFYPSDSNSVDARCRYQQHDDSWDCPGGTVTNAGVFQADSTKKGAGAYGPGNPQVKDAAGGGAGCHFDTKKTLVDQINTKPGTDWNLVMDKHCQCNYKFAHQFPQDDAHKTPQVSNGWDSWVSDLVQYGLKGKAGGAWQMDLASCWTNNVRDMINIQNRIYWQQRTWLDGTMPIYKDQAWDDPSDRRRYWGWNEVPVDRQLIGNPLLWDAILIHLPAFTCGASGRDDNVDCLNDQQKGSLQVQLDQHVQRGVLKPGLSQIAKRPGSYVLFVREIVDDRGNWKREFFCQNLALWKYKIVYDPSGPQSPTGKCYVDWG